MEEKKKFYKSLEDFKTRWFTRSIKPEVLAKAEAVAVEYGPRNKSRAKQLAEILLSKIIMAMEPKVMVQNIRLFFYLGYKEKDYEKFWRWCWPKGLDGMSGRDEDTQYCLITWKQEEGQLLDGILEEAFIITFKWFIGHGFIRHDMQEKKYLYLEYVSHRINWDWPWPYTNPLSETILNSRYNCFEPKKVDDSLELFLRKTLTPFQMEVVEHGYQPTFEEFDFPTLAEQMYDEVGEILNDVINIKKIKDICLHR